MSTLYKRHYYVNKSILDLVNEDIVEYDMKSAELSMIKHFNLLDEKDSPCDKGLEIWEKLYNERKLI